jgi:NADH-quinone oxidoreductase subunit A
MVWPLAVYFVLFLFLVAVTLIVSYLLGQRHSERATGEPYEGGIVSEGSAHVRLGSDPTGLPQTLARSFAQ